MRMIQGGLGVVAVLAIGLGATWLLGGNLDPDFAEQTTTTTVLETTTSFVNEAVAIDPNQFIGEPVWAVYFYVGSSGSSEADRVMATFAQDPEAWGIPHRGPAICDEQAPVQSAVDPDNEAIAFYFDNENMARSFAEHVTPSPLAVSEIVRTCAQGPVQSADPLTVFGIWNGVVVVEPEFLVAGETNVDGEVMVGGRQVSAGAGYFETTVVLEEGLNTFDVEVSGTELRQTVTVTYAPNAVRQFAFIDSFDGVTMTVDFADLLTGEAANTAARAAGVIGEGESVPNDSFISNVNPQLRSFVLADDLKIWLLGWSEEEGIVSSGVPIGVFADLLTATEHNPNWFMDAPTAFYSLIIEGDSILQIEQQYRP